MRKQKFNLPIKPILGGILFFAIVSVGIASVGTVAKKTDIFVIKDIIVREHNNNKGIVSRAQEGPADTAINISYLKGSNIFALDLQEEEDRVARLYRDCKTIRLIRVLPDRIVADYIRRKPLAYVKLYRDFYVDEDAVLFEMPASQGEPPVPLICGVEAKISGAKQGKKYNVKELLLAVSIIKEIKNNSALKDVRIKKIDVSDVVNTSFLVYTFSYPLAGPEIEEAMPNDTLEVKIGQEYINDKLNILHSLLIQEKNNWVNINYIDLRFKEPVIKFKETWKKENRS
jgi:hypothetical protein